MFHKKQKVSSTDLATFPVPANVKKAVTSEESQDVVSTTQESNSSKVIKGLRSGLRRSLGRSKKVRKVPSLLRLSC